jgi:DNA-binding LacI/PurR family transcriptional regulator
VPEAVSVVGFDDVSLDHVTHSQLTTVSVARDEVGRRAAEMLELLMTLGHDSEPQEVAMTLQVRDTSGAPRPSAARVRQPLVPLQRRGEARCQP